MQWTDEGIVLSARKHGETSLIVTLLTAAHGRHAGLVRGGAGRRARGVYQTGNLVSADWYARLSEHLGTLRCELLRALGAELLAERLPLLALQSAAALLDSTLPERQPQPDLYRGLRGLVEGLSQPGWAALYVRWEVDLLAELGFGLDLTECAVTGVTDGLSHVSPRTGRAVSGAAAEPYRGRLLALPSFLLPAARGTDPGIDEIAAGLSLTGHFLDHHVFPAAERQAPAARRRFVEAVRRGLL